MGGSTARGRNSCLRRALPGTLGLWVCAGAAAADEVLPFREAWGWAAVVPVQVEGRGPYELLVDTGATFSVLDPALAAELGVGAVGPATRLTLAGEDEVELARVRLGLGTASLDEVQVLVAAVPAIQADQPRIRGLLGQSALSRLAYTIDHERRRLVLHGSADASARARPAPGRPTLEVRLGCGKQPPSRFVLDSGVPAPVLFQRAGRPLDVEHRGLVRAATNGGAAVWREGRIASLCVAGRRTGPHPVVVRPETGDGREEDGLLPTRLFARVRVDPAGAVVDLVPW